MSSLKKLTLSLFVSTALLTAVPSVMAKPAGKIENATPAATVVAIDETLALAEEALNAVKSGELEKADMMKLFKTLKQKAKLIESTVTYSIREKALGRLGKARLAYKKGKDQAEVEALMQKSYDTFVELKNRYHNFGGD
ncbi:MAG: hypothetical protein KAH20_07960 [Methylococcales bacterium]|nr:hypothetical protein [Methylococcales bacterium]